uniref:Uncharacterized protein n=1 Tax=Cacopsylla melanoneura TaxID=428564 RepID=A0A8D8ZB65_9HEMI
MTMRTSTLKKTQATNPTTCTPIIPDSIPIIVDSIPKTHDTTTDTHESFTNRRVRTMMIMISTRTRRKTKPTLKITRVSEAREVMRLVNTTSTKPPPSLLTRASRLVFLDS